MGRSGYEFLARLDAGEYDGNDVDTVTGLVAVYMYLPFAR